MKTNCLIFYAMLLCTLSSCAILFPKNYVEKNMAKEIETHINSGSNFILFDDLKIMSNKTILDETTDKNKRKLLLQENQELQNAIDLFYKKYFFGYKPMPPDECDPNKQCVGNLFIISDSAIDRVTKLDVFIGNPLNKITADVRNISDYSTHISISNLAGKEINRIDLTTLGSASLSILSKVI